MPLFRHTFACDKPVRPAILFVSGLGQYEVHLNGRKITNAVMAPGWTNYGKKVLYDTYDVTGQVGKGSNTLGVMLGNGMYNVPSLWSEISFTIPLRWTVTFILVRRV